MAPGRMLANWDDLALQDQPQPGDQSLLLSQQPDTAFSIHNGGPLLFNGHHQHNDVPQLNEHVTNGEHHINGYVHHDEVPQLDEIGPNGHTFGLNGHGSTDEAPVLNGNSSNGDIHNLNEHAQNGNGSYHDTPISESGSPPNDFERPNGEEKKALACLLLS